jgi:hypothetical protein
LLHSKVNGPDVYEPGLFTEFDVVCVEDVDDDVFVTALEVVDVRLLEKSRIELLANLES